MTTKITWGITNLHRETADGYVYQIDFTVKASDEDNPAYEADWSAQIGLKKPDTLVPYKDITEAVALKWTQDTINELHAEDNIRNPSSKIIEDGLTKQLVEQIRPTKATGKPWS